MIMVDNEAKKHLKAITISIQELTSFQDRTRTPNPIMHQYIGTVVDNTVGLLCSAANSLDEGCRHIIFDQMKNWVSLMQAVHRSFFSSLHIAIEKEFLDLCAGIDLTAESSIRKRYIKVVNEISGNEPQKQKLLSYFNKCEPSFHDLLNALLKIVRINKYKKKIWRQYFKALTILRNKASHSDVTLSSSEKQSLNEGGFSVAVSRDGKIQMNSRMYAQIIKHILDFFDEANQSH